ncbi:unnamed protein product [Allacma fusca]|uniref:Uncharacterized protein n=1 Tax=Allacma fusca TaxID=39272 RepID=A0A8J2KEZ3_9HEXA|nr:unnamed protein product [Allacma fusca]
MYLMLGLVGEGLSETGNRHREARPDRRCGVKIKSTHSGGLILFSKKSCPQRASSKNPLLLSDSGRATRRVSDWRMKLVEADVGRLTEENPDFFTPLELGSAAFRFQMEKEYEAERDKGF